MALFGRDQEAGSREESPPVAPPPERDREGGASLIGPGIRVRGEVRGSSDLLIEGEVEGRLHLDGDVVVGSRGRVRGEIAARRVRIAGRVEGDVRGGASVEIQSGGRLQGDVSAASVVIGDGAFFKGNVEMTGGEGQPRGAAAGGRS